MSKSARRIVRNPITGEEINYSNELNSARQNENTQKYNQIENTSLKMPTRNEDLTQQKTIPLLNFDGFVNESDRIKQKQQSQQNPIIAPQQVIQSSRPKSSYRHGYDQMPLKSPIMNYQNELQNEATSKNLSALSSEKSQLEAPRKPKINHKKETFHLERIEDLEKLWILGDINAKQEFDTERKTENVDKNKPLKEQLVIDTVLTDQLSRFVLSEPEQDRRSATVRKLHNTAIQPKNSVNENILSRRIKFSCRLRTADGKNALRELFGIIFMYDGSLTIYEFRQLCGAYFTGIGTGNVSKKANALPFINRKVYKHAFGRRRGHTIDIFDLFKGSILYIPIHSKEPIETARDVDFYEIEVTDIDENEKEKLVSSHLTDNSSIDTERNVFKTKERFRQPYLEIELKDLKLIRSVQKFFHEQIETRSIKVFTGLGRLLKKRTEKMNGLIDFEQFHLALDEFNLQIHDDDLRVVWNILDHEGFGYLNYYGLLRVYLGEMNQLRHAYFRELMHKLDTQKSGYVQLTDVYKFYKARQHPKVKSGEISEKDLLENFLSCFESIKIQDTDYYHASMQSNVNSPLISFEQFENYYNGLSLVIESDSAFLNILKIHGVFYKNTIKIIFLFNGCFCA